MMQNYLFANHAMILDIVKDIYLSYGLKMRHKTKSTN